MFFGTYRRYHEHNQKWKLLTIFLLSNHGKTQKTGFLTIVRQEKPNPWLQILIYAFKPVLFGFTMVTRKKKSS